MAHFARINSENVVQEVIVVNNDVLLDDGVEQEALGQAFIASLGIEGTWLQCSYNGNMRGVFPGFGFAYDPDADVFAPPVYDSLEE